MRLTLEGGKHDGLEVDPGFLDGKLYLVRIHKQGMTLIPARPVKQEQAIVWAVAGLLTGLSLGLLVGIGLSSGGFLP